MVSIFDKPGFEQFSALFEKPQYPTLTNNDVNNNNNIDNSINGNNIFIDPIDKKLSTSTTSTSSTILTSTYDIEKYYEPCELKENEAILNEACKLGCDIQLYNVTAAGKLVKESQTMLTPLLAQGNNDKNDAKSKDEDLVVPFPIDKTVLQQIFWHSHNWQSTTMLYGKYNMVFDKDCNRMMHKFDDQYGTIYFSGQDIDACRAGASLEGVTRRLSELELIKIEKSKNNKRKRALKRGQEYKESPDANLDTDTRRKKKACDNTAKSLCGGGLGFRLQKYHITITIRPGGSITVIGAKYSPRRLPKIIDEWLEIFSMNYSRFYGPIRFRLHNFKVNNLCGKISPKKSLTPISTHTPEYLVRKYRMLYGAEHDPELYAGVKMGGSENSEARIHSSGIILCMGYTDLNALYGNLLKFFKLNTEGAKPRPTLSSTASSSSASINNVKKMANSNIVGNTTSQVSIQQQQYTKQTIVENIFGYCDPNTLPPPSDFLNWLPD